MRRIPPRGRTGVGISRSTGPPSTTATSLPTRVSGFAEIQSDHAVSLKAAVTNATGFSSNSGSSTSK
jgi:hypothetical protein